MKRLLLVLVFLLVPSMAHAKEAWRGWCEMGSRNVVTSGINSTTKVQQSFPQCTVSVYINGGGLAVLYSDNNGTPLANPFLSDTTGLWKFYAQNGRYDITTTQAGFPQPITYSDVLLCDPADATGGSCGTATGGNGCLLSGVDTGVVSEHPLGTCFDSIEFTWDSIAQVLLAGDGTATVTPNMTETYSFGAGNTLQDASQVYNFGDASRIWGISGGTGNEFYVIGDGNNTQRNGSETYTLGSGNNTLDTQFNIFSIGLGNAIKSTVASTQVNLQDVFVEGEDNSITTVPASHTTEELMIKGIGNILTNSGTGNIDNIYVYGQLNQVNSTTSAAISDVHILGAENIVANTLSATTSQVQIVGENNQVDGSISTVQILGFKNIAHNVSAQISGTVNTTLVGSANAATNTGATGAPAYQGVFGASNTLSNCVGCWIVGQGVSNSTNQTLAIGMSATPEMTITSGNVTFAPVAQGSLGTPADGTLKYCSTCNVATDPCTGGGNGAFAMRLNGRWRCQ